MHFEQCISKMNKWLHFNFGPLDVAACISSDPVHQILPKNENVWILTNARLNIGAFECGATRNGNKFFIYFDKLFVNMYAFTLRFSQSFFCPFLFNQVLFTLSSCHRSAPIRPKLIKMKSLCKMRNTQRLYYFAIVLDRLCQIKTHSLEQKIFNVHCTLYKYSMRDW